MKIIVTGAAGFIGSNLCETLLVNGHHVIGIDDLSKGKIANISRFKNNSNFNLHKIDIQNLQALKEIANSANTIVHLAAAKIPRYGDRLSTLNINTKGTDSVLEVARRNKIKVIFASTSDVYGKNPKIPFTENQDLVLGSSEVARWAYAASKIFDEHLCFAYWEKYQVPFIILRLFGVYGPKQHKNWWGGPQALFIDKISKAEPVEIHGSGNQIRTFVYISDVIDAIIKAIESKKAINQIINIGTDEEITIMELAKLTSRLISKPLKTKKIPYASFTGKKYEDVTRKVPSILKAKKLLGWKPKIGLHEGLQKTIDWQLKIL